MNRGTVGQLGQTVVQGIVDELLFGPFAIANVGDDALNANGERLIIGDNNTAPIPDPANITAGPANAVFNVQAPPAWSCCSFVPALHLDRRGEWC